MSNAINRDEIHRLAELVGAVAEQVRTSRVDELRGDVSTLAEVVGATSESLKIVVDDFNASDVSGLRASVNALSADVAAKLDAVRNAIEAKRAELAKQIDEANARSGNEALVLAAQLEAAGLRLGAIEADALKLRAQFAAALEKAKEEIGAELGNKVNASELARFRATSAEASAKLAETVETMRAIFSAQHEKSGLDFAELRRSFAAQVPITFGGIWEEGKNYPQNCVVSYYGGLWVSIRATRARPAKKSADWFAIISFRGGGGGGGGDTLPSQLGQSGKFLKTDGTSLTWATIAGGGDMLAANNLSDVANAATAFENIKVRASTTFAGVVTLASSGGTTAGTVVQATDSRLSDSRAPTAHATSHKSAGSDAIKLDELDTPTDVTTLNSTTAAHGLLRKLDGTTTNFLRGDGTWATPAGGSGGEKWETVFDGQGGVITTGVVIYRPVLATCTIGSAVLVSDVSCTATVQVRVFAPSGGALGSAITCGNIQLSGAVHNRDTSLTGWTRSLTAGNVVEFTTTGTIAGVTRLSVMLST